jgi:hypothetical protein
VFIASCDAGVVNTDQFLEMFGWHLCRECRKAKIDPADRYVYGVMVGEEAKERARVEWEKRWPAVRGETA